MRADTTERRRPSRPLLGAAVAALLVVAGLAATPAQGSPAIPRMPAEVPPAWTPRVVNDAVTPEAGIRKLMRVGTTMYAGGSVHTVTQGGRTYTRNNVFSFNSTTGAVTSFAPNANGEVWAIEPAADGDFYIGGEFSTWNGTAVNRMVKVDPVTGELDTRFRFTVRGARVSEIRLHEGRLFVAGTFVPGIVSVDPVTGRRTTYFDATRAAGAERGDRTRIYRFAINPNGDRMVVIGSFTSIGGQPRQQAAMLNIEGSSASVSPWYSTQWDLDCLPNVLRWYTRDVDWSPDGRRFAIVTTGGPVGIGSNTYLCDTATAWAANDLPNQRPVWIQYSGGDTFHSVAYTDDAIFVSGHFRWLDNPNGRDSQGAGSVPRRGIAAIHPATGRAASMDWNPGKGIEGGLGGFDLYVLPDQGLWVGHMEMRLGKNRPDGLPGQARRDGLGLLPF